MTNQEIRGVEVVERYGDVTVYSRARTWGTDDGGLSLFDEDGYPVVAYHPLAWSRVCAVRA